MTRRSPAIFDLQDAGGVPHNFAIYRQGPPAQDRIKRSEVATGPVAQEVAVNGLSEGTYFYQCDVHPTTMTGKLVVK